jgi:hypothetical protein
MISMFEEEYTAAVMGQEMMELQQRAYEEYLLIMRIESGDAEIV